MSLKSKGALLLPMLMVGLACGQQTVPPENAGAAGVGAGHARSSDAPRLAPPTDAMPLPLDRGVNALWQDLRKLRTRASLLAINAHPDDEDGGVLTYESRGEGARVALMSLTRGEGGQNAMNDELWDALGLIRTQELLQADRYYGVAQYFGRFTDFGFSKTKEEALEQWGHDRVLYDAVRVVRLVRPLVVTSSFVGAPTDGHGQHQVAGLTAQEVFDAAADANVFPDQIKAGLRSWKPLKIYERVPRFPVTPRGMYDYATAQYVPVRFYDYVHKKWIEGPLSTDLEVPSSDYDPVLGENYVQIAREGLGAQKTQNGGTGVLPAGVMTRSSGASAYHRFASAVDESGKVRSFFNGVDVSLAGIADLAPGKHSASLKRALSAISDDVESATSELRGQPSQAVTDALVRGLAATRALIAQVVASDISAEEKYNVEYELRVKEQQFEKAIADSLGLTLLATVAPEKAPTGPFSSRLAETFQMAVPGQQFMVTVQAVNPSSSAVTVQALTVIARDRAAWSITPQDVAPHSLANNIVGAQSFRIVVPDDATLTRPYFSRSTIEQPFYDIDVPADVGLPVSPYPLVAELTVDVGGEPIHLAAVVQTATKIVGPGLELQPLLVAPAISIGIAPRHGIVPLGGAKLNLTINLRSNVAGAATGTVHLGLPPGWKSDPADAPFRFEHEGELLHIPFSIIPGVLEQKPYEITAHADYNGKRFTEGFRLTGYGDLRPYPLYAPAKFDTRGVDVKVAPDLKVAYIAGTGDEVPQSLQAIGVEVRMLSPEEIATGDLSRYDCIVLGARAYAVRPELATHNLRLLEYVKNGGVLFVQYGLADLDHNYGPFPFTMTSDPERVVDERAAVQMLDAKNPIFNWPNQITSADFDGWIEERGHGFIKSWDPHYEALTETHDPGQAPQRGGLLYARYGRGAYVYAAFALYRQLPEGVPGAFRLVANILSLAKSPAFRSVDSHLP